jgi:methionyl-tRNA formyltransferase
MQIDAGLDTGDMLLKAETGIGADETAPELSARLAPLGADVLIETLRRIEAGTITPEKQNHAEATLAPILRKEDGLIDWTRPAPEIHNRSRGFLPWPGTYTYFRGQLLHIWRAKPVIHIELGPAGMVHISDRRVLVACGDRSALELEEVQLEGRKRIAADAFRNGQRLTGKEILGEKTS